jgi:hypothetical protein
MSCLGVVALMYIGYLRSVFSKGPTALARARRRVKYERLRAEPTDYVETSAGGLGTRPCPDSWVLSAINESARQRVEGETGQWYRELPRRIERLYDQAAPRVGEALPAREPRYMNRFDAMMPTMTGACDMRRLGLEDFDGGKWVCGLERIPKETSRPCIVYR